jgi:hypothetical protein
MFSVNVDGLPEKEEHSELGFPTSVSVDMRKPGQNIANYGTRESTGSA